MSTGWSATYEAKGGWDAKVFVRPQDQSALLVTTVWLSTPNADNHPPLWFKPTISWGLFLSISATNPLKSRWSGSIKKDIAWKITNYKKEIHLECFSLAFFSSGFKEHLDHIFKLYSYGLKPEVSLFNENQKLSFLWALIPETETLRCTSAFLGSPLQSQKLEGCLWKWLWLDCAGSGYRFGSHLWILLAWGWASKSKCKNMIQLWCNDCNLIKLCTGNPL